AAITKVTIPITLNTMGTGLILTTSTNVILLGMSPSGTYSRLYNRL
ncbi:MAG: hypothetical protein ACJA1N_002032, partial [Saprospiraceae bacterium]